MTFAMWFIADLISLLRDYYKRELVLALLVTGTGDFVISIDFYFCNSYLSLIVFMTSAFFSFFAFASSSLLFLAISGSLSSGGKYNSMEGSP